MPIHLDAAPSTVRWISSKMASRWSSSVISRYDVPVAMVLLLRLNFTETAALLATYVKSGAGLPSPPFGRCAHQIIVDCRSNLLANLNKIASYFPWPTVDSKSYRTLVTKWFSGTTLICGGCNVNSPPGYYICFDESRDSCHTAVYSNSLPNHITLCPNFFDNWTSLLQMILVTIGPYTWSDLSLQLRTSIVLHEAIHMVDYEWFRDVHGIDPHVAIFAGSNAPATEYHAAYIQARWLGLSADEADIFGNAYSRWWAGETDSTVDYFIKGFMDYHINHGTPGLAASIFFIQAFAIANLPLNPNPVIQILNLLAPMYSVFWSFLALLHNIMLVV